jgi:hypothetical protein
MLRFDPDQPVYTRRDVATLLDLSVRTVSRHLASGRYEGGTVINGKLLFSVNDVDRFRKVQVGAWYQPTLPGMEHLATSPSGAPFTDDQARLAASTLDDIAKGAT